ncbi:hypothetical protein ACLESO_08770 [Pyxidicoccus sp. 3LG]
MSSPSLPRFPGVPDLLIERYLCGELSSEEALRVEEAARASPELAAHLERRRAEQQAFAAVRPFAPVGARIETQQSRKREQAADARGQVGDTLHRAATTLGLAGAGHQAAEAGARGWVAGVIHRAATVLGLAGSRRQGADSHSQDAGTRNPAARGLMADLRWALPALGLCALVAVIAVREPSSTNGDDTVRVRGGLTARVLVKRGEAVFEQRPGVVLRPGDRVRVEVEDVEGGTLYVVGLSDRGRATPLHGFEQTGGAVQMEPGRLLLPGSLELDAAPEREALVVVLAAKAKDAPAPEAVLQWVRESTRDTDFPPHPAPLPGTRYSLRELPKEQP